MTTHHRDECVHGTLVSQCRCATPDKTVKVVPCPAWCKHKDSVSPEEESTPSKSLEQVAFERAKALFPIHPGGVTDVRDVPQLERNRAIYVMGYIDGWAAKE